MSARNRLVIIDGKSVFYRGYYAMPNLSTRDGQPTGAIYGFAAIAMTLVQQLNPAHRGDLWICRHCYDARATAEPHQGGGCLGL